MSMNDLPSHSGLFKIMQGPVIPQLEVFCKLTNSRATKRYVRTSPPHQFTSSYLYFNTSSNSLKIPVYRKFSYFTFDIIESNYLEANECTQRYYVTGFRVDFRHLCSSHHNSVQLYSIRAHTWCPFWRNILQGTSGFRESVTLHIHTRLVWK